MDALLDRIRASVIGDDLQVPGPCGPRRLVFADHTPSGRALGYQGSTSPQSVNVPWS